LALINSSKMSSLPLSSVIAVSTPDLYNFFEYFYLLDLILSKQKVGRMEIPHMKFETFLPIYRIVAI